MDIKDKHIIITGATGGLGGALIEQLSPLGCTITAIGRNRKILQALQNDYGVTPLALDLTKASSRKTLSDYVAKNPADILINSAAILNIEEFAHCPDSHIDDVVAINLTALMATTRICLPSMLKKSTPCKVLNIASVGADLGLPYFTVYTATKFGVKGFTESLRRELGSSNTDAVLIAPRAMKTPMMDETAVGLLRAMFSGMDDVDKIAKKIVGVIQNDRARMRVGLFERLGGLMNSVMPWATDIVFRILTPIMKTHVDRMNMK